MTSSGKTSEEARSQIINTVREFVKRDVIPVASQYEHEDIYPHELINQMVEMGLFGINVPEEYGGMGLDYTTFAAIFEELAKGWLSITGPIGTHHVLTNIISSFGTDNQKQQFLPALVRGEKRGGLGLTEPNAGSESGVVQSNVLSKAVMT